MGIIVYIGVDTNFTNHVLPYTSCVLQIISKTLFNNASRMHDIHEVAQAYAGKIVCSQRWLCVRVRTMQEGCPV